jgi:hypothetical protein
VFRYSAKFVAVMLTPFALVVMIVLLSYAIVVAVAVKQWTMYLSFKLWINRHKFRTKCSGCLACCAECLQLVARGLRFVCLSAASLRTKCLVCAKCCDRIPVAPPSMMEDMGASLLETCDIRDSGSLGTDPPEL